MPGNCAKCGGGSVALAPTYSVHSTIQQIDGQTANVQFRSAISFDLNKVPYYFMTSEVKRLPYNVIRAALEIDTNLVMFLNGAEKMDFVKRFPEAARWGL